MAVRVAIRPVGGPETGIVLKSLTSIVVIGLAGGKPGGVGSMNAKPVMLVTLQPVAGTTKSSATARGRVAVDLELAFPRVPVDDA